MKMDVVAMYAHLMPNSLSKLKKKFILCVTLCEKKINIHLKNSICKTQKQNIYMTDNNNKVKNIIWYISFLCKKKRRKGTHRDGYDAY